MVDNVVIEEEISSLEELDLWFQGQGWKKGYGIKLFSAPRGRNAALKTSVEEGVNEYEAFCRWFAAQPIRY